MHLRIALALLCLALAGCPTPPVTCTDSTDCLVGQHCNTATQSCVSGAADASVPRPDAGQPPPPDASEALPDAGPQSLFAVVEFDRRVTQRAGASDAGSVDYVLSAQVGPVEVGAFCPAGGTSLGADCCVTTSYPRDLSSSSLNAGDIIASIRGNGTANVTLSYKTDGYPPITTVPAFDTGSLLSAASQGGTDFDGFGTPSLALPAQPAIQTPQFSGATAPIVVRGSPLSVKWSGTGTTPLTLALSDFDSTSNTLKQTVRCQVPDNGAYTFTGAATSQLTAGTGMLRIDRLARAQAILDDNNDTAVGRAVHASFGQVTLQ